MTSMRRGSSRWAGLAAAVMAWSPLASAKCADPVVAIAPDSGNVPADPTVFVFAPAGASLRGPDDVRVTGARVIERTFKPGGAGLTVLRLKLRAPAGAKIAVSVASPVEPWRPRRPRVVTADLWVDGSWHRPKGATFELRELRRRKYQWTCSANDTIEAVPSLAAPAYRVRLATTEEEVTAGRGQAFVVPWSVDAMFRLPGEERPPELVSLGFANCFGSTLPAGTHAEAIRHFRVEALLPDGSVFPSDTVDATRASLDESLPWDEGDSLEEQAPQPPVASAVGAMDGPLSPRSAVVLGTALLALSGIVSFVWSLRSARSETRGT